MAADITQFFKLDPKEKNVRFMGDKLECFIPIRYQARNLLIVESKISALGIFTMKINDSIECGIQIPAVIQMDPVDTRTVTINGDQFFVCELHKGNLFMTTTTVLQNGMMGYLIWLEFLSLGNVPSFYTYTSIMHLFDDLKEITGKGVSVDHSTWEIIYAHIFRDSKDITKHYRHSDMIDPPKIITLRDVSHNVTSTHAKIIGSFADDGRNAALINHSDQHSDLEDFFRS